MTVRATDDGLRRLLRRPDYICAPLSRSRVPNVIGSGCDQDRARFIRSADHDFPPDTTIKLNKKKQDNYHLPLEDIS